ncbi:MAG: HpsJ family protein [Leptolyngbyaceae bacterium]|nr:HpsJ family protein [Leptolyngbyaceae bacterium]
MNAITNRQLSPLLSLACRSTGMIMVLASLVNMGIGPWPYNFQDREWLLSSFTSPVVEQGIIALVGVVLIVGSCWLDSLMGDTQAPSSAQTSAALWTLIVSVISVCFSFFFLLMLFLHMWNLFPWRSEQIAGIAEETAKLETQLQDQIEQQTNLIRTYWEDTALRQSAIEQGQLSNEEIAFLEGLDNNPDGFNVIEEGLQSRLSETQVNLNLQRQEQQNDVAQRVLRSALRTGSDSLLLTLGFGAIGWTGMRLYLKGGKR